MVAIKSTAADDSAGHLLKGEDKENTGEGRGCKCEKMAKDLSSVKAC